MTLRRQCKARCRRLRVSAYACSPRTHWWSRKALHNRGMSIDRLRIDRLSGTRDVVPLREGGSLPAIVETEDGRSFVVKFQGAGQGAKALVAEAVVAGLAKALDLPVPTPAIVDLAEGFGVAEAGPRDSGH